MAQLKIVLTRYQDLDRSPIYLIDTYSVEKEFLHVLNWDKEAFRDELSLRLMKEIDTAERVGDYGVVTHIGESCISCLSTGCKLGLLVIYHQMKYPDAILLTEMHAAGDNVWRWLAQNTDATLYVYWDDYDWLFVLIDGIVTEIDGVQYTKENVRELLQLIDNHKYAPYHMSKEAEAESYKRATNFKDRDVCCDLKEEISLDEFVMRFPDGQIMYECFPDYEIEYGTYKVINYASYLPKEYDHRKHPIYMCRERCGETEYHFIRSEIYPTFLGLLFNDVIAGCFFCEKQGKWELCRFYDEYEKWFALVLDAEEKCRVKEYPERALHGIEVDRNEKTITIYDSKKAVDKFHELYQKTK